MTVLTGDLGEQRTVAVGREPMDIAFDSRSGTAVIGNQGDGTLSAVDLDDPSGPLTVHADRGVETLAFF